MKTKEVLHKLNSLKTIKNEKKKRDLTCNINKSKIKRIEDG